MIKAAITDELLKPKEQRSAIYTGVHGTDTSFFFFGGENYSFGLIMNMAKTVSCSISTVGNTCLNTPRTS